MLSSKELVDYNKLKDFFEISKRALDFNQSLTWDSSIKNVYLVSSIKELIEVYRLRSKVYKQMGYSIEYPDFMEGLNFDNYDTRSAILYAKRGDKITGSCRLIFDSPLKLPLDKFFSLDNLRKKRKKIVELSRLVIDKKDKGLSQEPRLLTKGAYLLMKQNNKTTLVSLMIKEHYRFYKRFGGFEIKDEIKNLGQINKEFSFITWEVTEVSDYFKKLFLAN